MSVMRACDHRCMQNQDDDLVVVEYKQPSPVTEEEMREESAWRAPRHAYRPGDIKEQGQ